MSTARPACNYSHTSARSVFGQTLVNAMPHRGLRAYSAGSDPIEAIRPDTKALLESLSIPTAELYPKHWAVFTKQDAPVMDFVFTVCDKAAGQPCPVWPGRPVTARWGIPDPAAVTGGEQTRQRAFRDAFHAMRSRINLFATLPLASLDRVRLQQQATDIGQSPIPLPEEPCHE